MKNWTEIITEFLNANEPDNETRIVTYQDDPFLLIDSYYSKDFFDKFNEWFKGTDYYKELEETTIIKDYEESILDALNAEYGYSDEYAICYVCGQAIKTGDNADNHWLTDGAILCEICTRKNTESYIYEHLIYNYNTGIPESGFHINQILSETELKKNGFKKYSKEYEVGFYGTYDDPHEILTDYINANRDTDYIINMISQNPFATEYQIWKRNNKTMTEEHKNLLYKIALEVAMETNIGSITREQMRELHRQLDYAPYCKELGIEYDDLTEEDIEEIAFMKARDAGYEVQEEDK